MKISYNKLWKLLIDKKMNKTGLTKATGISTSTMSKLSRGENVNTNVLVKICQYLDCDLGDIAEISKED